MKVVFTFWLSFVVIVCTAQTVMTADKTKVIIGDQIKATITTNLSEGREWRNVDEVWPDSIRGMEVVSGPEIDNKNPASARYTWNISVFDTGWVMIPAVPVIIREGNNLDTFYTTDIPVEVMAIEPDSSGLAPMKDIIRQPFSLAYYKKYLPHLIVLILILAGIYYWWRQRKKKLAYVPPPEPEPLPHEWALRKLDELEQLKLWQKGEVKEHYSLLTSILREYLERRYAIKALEQTSDEIQNQMHGLQLSNALLTDTQQLLSVADLIKFAKADPGVDLHAATIERVRRFVKETMLLPELSPVTPTSTNETVE